MLVKLKYLLSSIGRGATPSNSYYNGELLWITISDIQDSFISTTIKKITSHALKDYHLKLFPIDSIAISLRGSLKFGILLKEATVSENCCLLFCDPSRLNYFYLYYYFLYLRSINFSLFYPRGSLFQTITIDVLKSLPIPFFPLSRQGQIVSFLNLKFDLIQKLFQKIDLFLKKLEEYQASLIYEKIYQKSYSRKKANSYISILGGVPCSYDPKGFIPVYGSGGIFQKTNQILYSGESVLVGRKGTLNKPFYLSSSSQFWIVDTVYCIQNKNPLFLNLKYFYYFYCSLHFEEIQSGSVLPSMTQSSILSLLLPLPSLIQQNAIVLELDSQICLLSQLQHHYQSLRAHLEEYQSSLLYETFQHLP